MQKKYDSGCNIVGSIPDYSNMLDFISDTYGTTSGSAGAFSFRTEKSLQRFIAAIEKCILRFASDQHRRMFFSAIADQGLSVAEKLIVLFWQFVYANRLFGYISQEVFMRSIYSGRVSITADEVLSFLKYVNETEPRELEWSEGTLKISASKYLTILKKMGLAEGVLRKEIIHPVITDYLFCYIVRLSQCIYPEDKTISNPLLYFSFCDRKAIASRLKKIDNIQYWDISQIGNELIIDLK